MIRLNLLPGIVHVWLNDWLLDTRRPLRIENWLILEGIVRIDVCRFLLLNWAGGVELVCSSDRH